jgi:hypothetical protein
VKVNYSDNRHSWLFVASIPEHIACQWVLAHGLWSMFLTQLHFGWMIDLYVAPLVWKSTLAHALLDGFPHKRVVCGHLRSEQELFEIILRFCHPKAATVDLMAMDPFYVRRNCLLTSHAKRVMLPAMRSRI